MFVHAVCLRGWHAEWGVCLLFCTHYRLCAACVWLCGVPEWPCEDVLCAGGALCPWKCWGWREGLCQEHKAHWRCVAVLAGAAGVLGSLGGSPGQAAGAGGAFRLGAGLVTRPPSPMKY